MRTEIDKILNGRINILKALEQQQLLLVTVSMLKELSSHEGRQEK